MSVPEKRTVGPALPRNDKEATVAARPRKWRVAIYSHDTGGIGHTRRSLLLAQAFAGSRLPMSILLIAGAREVSSLGLPDGADCLTLPALHKEPNGSYRPRALDVSLKELIDLRSRVIVAGLLAFDPDVLVVDQEPRGAFRELDLTLSHLAGRRRTRLVLGLRDVLDDPDTVQREWESYDSARAVREHYDAVWVYGDPAVYDPVREYRFPLDVAARVRYTGYLDRHLRSRQPEADTAEVLNDLSAPADRLALCLVGSGYDGGQLAEAFAGAPLPRGYTGVVLMGPFMPADVQRRLKARAAALPRLRVIEFVTDPDLLLSRADRVVAMGGYNTIFEVLSAEKHALIVPRVQPSREQLIRAERLRDLGLIHLLHPDDASSQAIGRWLARDLGAAPKARQRIDLGGTARLPQLLADVLSLGAHPAAGPTRESVVQAAAT